MELGLTRNDWSKLFVQDQLRGSFSQSLTSSFYHKVIRRAIYEQRYDAAFMDRLRSELSGSLEHLCLRLMSGARGLAEEGRNFTESPEQLGIYYRHSL